MKKLLSLLLICIMLAIGAGALADAPQWAEGLSPAKPFTYVEETDLTAHVGYFLTAPENDTDVACGVDTLTIYLPRTDLTGFAGELTVTIPGGEAYARCDMAQSTIAPLTADELAAFGWGEGMSATFVLDRALAPDSTYCINIPEGAFLLTQLREPSGRLTGATMWTVRTLSYGTANMTAPGSVVAGSECSFDIVLGGEAVRAELVIATPDTLSSDKTAFTRSGRAALTYTAAGEYAYEVVFYDAQGQALDGLMVEGTIE